jgi:hypothetical protein
MASARTAGRSITNNAARSITVTAGIKPSSSNPPGSVKHDEGRQSTFANSKYFDCRHVSTASGLEVGPKSTWGTGIRFLGLPEGSREMEDLQGQRHGGQSC